MGGRSWKSEGKYQKACGGTEQAELEVLLHGWKISCKKSACP